MMAATYPLEDDSLTLPPVDLPSWRGITDDEGTSAYGRDRYRLGRELAADFQDMSFSDVLPPGNGDMTDTLGSLDDIANDVDAQSTRHINLPVPTPYKTAQTTPAAIAATPAGKSSSSRRAFYTPGRPILPLQTPTIDSRMMRDQFADFTMVAEGFDNNTLHSNNGDHTDDVSVEIGRGRHPGDSILNETAELFSFTATGAPNTAKKRATAQAQAEKEKEKERQQFNRISSPAKRREKSQLQQEHSFGSPLQKLGFQTLNFSPPPTSTPPKRTGSTRSRLSSSGSAGREGPSKIRDFVSSAGSSGGRKLYPRDSEEDALSDVASVTGRVRASNTRFTRRTTFAGETTEIRGKEDDLTQDLPNILQRARKTNSNSTNGIPKSFKSTPEFLRELGLDGHTQTLNLQNKLRELKDAGGPPKRTSSPRLARRLGNNIEQTFLIPNMPDMTELFSANDATRFSTKKHAAALSHHALASIPIPHDSRALLKAMKLLQDKVASLENAKATNQQKCARLENELKKAELKYQQEMKRARLAEEEMRKRRTADTTFGGSEDGDAEERHKENTRIQWMMEKLKSESLIKSLRIDIEAITEELETAKFQLSNMQDERNRAISSVAVAISSNEDLKEANNNLERRLEQLRIEKEHARYLSERQQEDFKAKEERLRKRAREAREAAVIAEEAMREAARRDAEAEREAALRKREEARMEQERIAQEEAEQRRLEKELRLRQEEERIAKEQEQVRRAEAKWEFDRKVEEELRRIRPDMFVGRTEPIQIPHGTPPRKAMVEVEGRSRVIAMPRQRRQARRVVAESSDGGDDTRELPPPLPPKEPLEAPKEPKGKERAYQPEPPRSAPLPPRTITPLPPKVDLLLPAKEEAIFQSNIDDTNMSITPDEIRRIAKEINAERKKRKAAAAAAKKAEQEALERARLEAEAQAKREAELEAARNLPLPDETAIIPQPEPQEQQQQQQQPPQKKKGRRVIKVVYVMDNDDTEVLDLERELEGNLDNAVRNARLNISLPAEQELPLPPPPPPPPFAQAPHPQQQKEREDRTVTFVPPAPFPPPFISLPEVELPQQPSPAPPLTDSPAEPEPVESEPEPENYSPAPRLHPLLDHATTSADHDPAQCTVCIRYDRLRRKQTEQDNENLLVDIDASCLLPAPPLQLPVQLDGGEPTLRPTAAPKVQLERVVRQLKDEFRHLKLTYQSKSQLYLSLDPSVGKKRRKTLTREMNELVAEMDAKSDQIYALYDVNENFIAQEEAAAAEGRGNGNGNGNGNEGMWGGMRGYECGEETEDLIRSLGMGIGNDTEAPAEES